MNPKAQLEFDRITIIPVKELTKEEIGFIRARRMYLRPEQTQIYAGVLKGASEISKEERASFVKANSKEVTRARKEAEAKAKLAKSIKESQNPEGK